MTNTENAAMITIMGPNKDAVMEARKAISDILRAKVNDSTKREALKTLFNLCGVHDTVISNCTFSNK